MQNKQTTYKNTEIGPIPDDWDIVSFNDIADKNKKWSITGGPFGSNLKTTDYTDEGVQIIQLQNIGDGKFINESQVFTSIAKANQLLSCNIYPTDIILSKMGDPVARACLIPSHANRYLMASDGIRLLVYEKEFNKYFILEYINSEYFRQRAIEISTGSTRQRISLPQLKKLQCIKPSLSEQTAIATALADTDALITSLEQLINKKRAIKQAAMQELLRPKDVWEVKKLGDCLIKNPDYGINAAAVEYDDKLPQYIRISDISENGKYIQDNKVSVNNVLSDSFYLEEGDIVFARTGASVGKTYLYNHKDGRLVFAGFLIRVKANPEILLSKYLFYFTQTIYYWNWVLANSMRSGQPGLNSNEYKFFQIQLPTLEDQNRIATILSDMDTEMENLRIKLHKYEQIKQGMMQQLLTGKIRLV